MKTLAYLILALWLVGCAVPTPTPTYFPPSKGIETCVEWEPEKCPPRQAVQPAPKTEHASNAPLVESPDVPPDKYREPTKEEREAYKFSWEEFLKGVVAALPLFIP
jgi:hypothetical protein